MDLAFDPRNGRLYVYQIARKGWLAFEEGFAPGGTFPPAVLLEVRGRERRELVRGKLSQPGGIVVTRAGEIFVTDGMFTGGRLLRIRREVAVRPRRKKPGASTLARPRRARFACASFLGRLATRRSARKQAILLAS